MPAGTFYKGGSGGIEGTAKAEPMKDFYLAIHEVTQGQWKAVMGKDNNPSFFSRTGRGKAKVEQIKEAESDRFPVENVSWRGEGVHGEAEREGERQWLVVPLADGGGMGVRLSRRAYF